MNDTDVRERPGWAHRPGGPPFDLVLSKLLRPLVRPLTIRRTPLLDRLADGDPRRIVVRRPVHETTSHVAPIYVAVIYLRDERVREPGPDLGSGAISRDPRSCYPSRVMG